MNSTTSTGRTSPISSIRTDGGERTEAALLLGRELADQLQATDTSGRWMGHQLAELIQAAEQDATAEQRIEIVELILKVWRHRSHMVRRWPLRDFSGVLETLAWLGDDSVGSMASRRFGIDFQTVVRPIVREGDVDELHLLRLVADIERTCRDAIIRLLWQATRDAASSGADWIKLAEQVEPLLETQVARGLRRLRLQPIDSDEPDENATETDVDELISDLTETPQDEDGTVKIVAELRAMANRLNAVAARIEDTSAS